MAVPRSELACVLGCADHHAICRWRDRAFGASAAVRNQNFLEHLFVSSAVFFWIQDRGAPWTGGRFGAFAKRGAQ
jgi:hypothetical protein